MNLGERHAQLGAFERLEDGGVVGVEYIHFVDYVEEGGEDISANDNCQIN